MLAGISSIRNELLADIFLKMRIVEKWGTGIKRVAELCKNHGLGEVKYTADEEFFTATIYRTKKDLFAKDVSSEISLGFPQNFPGTSPKLHQKSIRKRSENI